MTDRAKEWLSQWLSPGVIMGVLGWLVIVVGAWYRLSTLEATVINLATEVKASAHVTQEAKEEAIRLQERMGTALARIDSLERSREAQTDYNAATMSQLAVLKNKIGG